MANNPYDAFDDEREPTENAPEAEKSAERSRPAAPGRSPSETPDSLASAERRDPPDDPYAQFDDPYAQFDETPDEANTRINDRMAERRERKDQGFFENVGRGIAERAAKLSGHLVGTEAEATKRRPNVPVGTTGYSPVPTSVPQLELSEEEREQGYQDLMDVSRSLQELDLGYDPERNTLDGAQDKWKKGNYLGAATELYAAGNQTILTSLPDMIGAGVAPVAPAYVMARSHELGTERARNSGRETPTADDMMYAAPAATASAVLERILPGRLLRGTGELSEAAAKDISDHAVRHVMKKTASEGAQAAGIEGATEFVQEGIIEYLGERLGTEAGVDYREMLARGTEGAILGAVGGGTLGAGRGTVEGGAEAVRSRRMGRQAGPEADPDLDPDVGGLSDFTPGEKYRHNTGPGSFSTVEFIREVEGPDGSTMAEVDNQGQVQYVPMDELGPRAPVLDQTPEEIEADLTGDADLDAEIQAALDDAETLENTVRRQTEQRADKTASVPTMMTQDMRSRLAGMGYSRQAIRAMRPAEAWEVLNDGREPAQNEREVQYDEGVDFEPPAVPQRQEGPEFDLEPMEGDARASYDGGVDFEPQTATGQPDTARRDELASGVQQEIDRGIDQRIDQRLPEGLPDRRLIRREYRDRLDQVAEIDIPKSDSNTVQPRTDELMTAIAKSGGLSLDEARAQGIDPEHFKDRPGANNPFRKEGRSFDEMAEHLSQMGYTPSDYSANGLLEQVSNSLAGDPVYSEQVDRDALEAVESMALPEGVSPADAQKAVQKALRGDKLGTRQAAVVESMLDDIRDRRAESRPESVIDRWQRIDNIRQGIESGNDQAILDSLEMEPLEGETPTESALAELVEEAQNIGVPEADIQDALQRYSGRAEGSRARLFSMMNEWMRSQTYGRDQQESVVPPGRGDERGAGAPAPARGTQAAQSEAAAGDLRGDGGPFEGGPLTEADTQGTGTRSEVSGQQDALVDPADPIEQTRANMAGRDESEAGLVLLRDMLELGTDSMNEAALPPSIAQDASELSDRITQTLDEGGDVRRLQQDALNQIAEWQTNEDLGDAANEFNAVRRHLERQLGQDGDRPAMELESYTEQDLAYREREQQVAQQEQAATRQQAEQRAAADRERDDFVLSGSDTAADQAAARGQADLLTSAPKETVKADETSRRKLDEHIKSNTETTPTEAQKEAGNYRKAAINVQGLDISIENPRGSTRSGTDPDGNAWSVTMKSDYGYIRRQKEGADGDAVDVFVGPNPKSEQVFVVDQANRDGSFDEHKVMLGFDSKLKARSGYKANYTRGWKVGPITSMSMDDFKDWLQTANLKKPASPDFVVNKTQPREQQTRSTRTDERQGAPVSRETAPEQPIEDFGKEKVGGARKDYAQSYRESLKDASDATTNPLSKSWPEPNYQALIDAGTEPWVVAFARASRDFIPPKPRKKWRVAGWASKVEMLRDMTQKLLTGELNQDQVKREFLLAGSTTQLSDFQGLIDLYQAVGHDKSLKGLRFSQANFSLYEGKKYDPPKTLWMVEKAARGSAFSNMPHTIVKAETKEGALDKFKKVYDKLDQAKEKADRQVRFDVYTTRRDRSDVFIGKKIGRDVVRIKDGFGSVREAADYVTGHHAELVSTLEKLKEIPAHRKETNAPRVGIDHRSGGDVTPQQFEEAFGFKWVEFGNWVEQGRRQGDLNRAYDALMDLAGIINVPARALSLNGELSLGFGSRGKGGKGAAAAHYEPGKIAINLTKKEGAGSLGHEWFHALDNYFSRARGKAGDMMTDKPYSTSPEVRLEVVEAFAELTKAIASTRLRERSAKLDEVRSKEYWTTKPEMAARAFESYVIEKARAQGLSNDYLANIVSQDYWDAAAKLGMEKADSYPYPEAGEIPVIAGAFDHLFNTIETKETDQGMALYEPEGDYMQTSMFDEDGEPVSNIRTQAKDEFNVKLVQTETRVVNIGVDNVNSIGDAAHVLAPMRKHGQEVMSVLMADADGKPLSIAHISKGGRFHASVDILDVVGAIAATKGAKKIWLSHNHPSGNVDPSQADLSLTYAIAKEAMSGMDVEFMGHIITGAGGKISYFKDGLPDVVEGRPTPARRNKRLPVTERVFRYRSEPGQQITSPEQARSLVNNLESEAAVVLMDNKHHVLGTVSMTRQEMSSLRANKQVPRLFDAINRTNAAAAIAKAPDQGAAMNIRNFLGRDAMKGVRLLDVIYPGDMGQDVSLAERADLKPLGMDLWYSRQETEPTTETRVPRADAEAVVRRTMGKVRGRRPKVHLLDDASGFPDSLKGGNINLRTVDGVYYQGEIYLNRSAMRDQSAVESTLFHELYGHYGIRSLFGKQTMDQMARLYTAIGGAKGLNDIAARHGINMRHYARDFVADMKAGRITRDQAYAAMSEELLAHIAQDSRPTVRRRLQELLGALRNWLREKGFSALSKFSDADLYHLLKRARDAVHQGKDGRGNDVRYMVAYHGSPHTFDRFSLDAMGIGEGAQAYGWGLYFAGKRSVAEYYRNELSIDRQGGDAKGTIDRLMEGQKYTKENVAEAIEELKRRAEPSYVSDDFRAKMKEAVDLLESGYRPGGSLYQVDIPTDNQLLDWDKPLSEQPKEVRSKLEKTMKDLGYERLLKAAKSYDAGNQRAIKDAGFNMFDYPGAFGGLYDAMAMQSGKQAVSEALGKAGIPGLRYLDQVSREDGEGSYNYVVWDESAVTIEAVNDEVRQAEEQAMFSRRDPDQDPNNMDQELEVARKLGLEPKEEKSILQHIRALKMADVKNLNREFWNRADEGLFDGLLGIKRAEEEVGMTVGQDAEPGSFERSGYVGARLATGVSDIMHHILNYGAVKWDQGVLVPIKDSRGLLDIVGGLGSDANNWLMWMAGNRAAELMKQGRENNLTKADIAYLMGKAKGKLDTFKKAKAEYNAINKAMLDVADGAGLIDPDSRKDWESDWYIPFYRQEDEGVSLLAPRSKKGLSHQTAGIKRLRGGEQRTGDLLENVLTNWLKLADASVKNSALLKTVGNLQGSDFISNETVRYQQVLVPRSEIAKRIKQDRELLAMVSRDLGMDDGADAVEVAAELNKPENQGYEKMFAPSAPTDPDIIRVQRNGKNEYYRVHDASLLRAVSHLGFDGFNDPVTRGFRWFKRLLTTGVTSSPDFMIRNFVRDAVHAWAINPDGFKLARSSISGVKQAMEQNEDYRTLIAGGAAFQGGYVHGTDPQASAQQIRRSLLKHQLRNIDRNSVLDTPQKLWSAVQWGWQRYREVGDKVENSSRLATYQEAIKAGKPPAQALFESKDLMDYSRRGNFQALIWLTDVVPFVNARLQGTNRLYRSGMSIPAIMGRKAAMIAGFSFMLASLNDDDERYQELPDWEKDAYWHVFLYGNHLRIPKPFEIGIVAGTIPERIWHRLIGEQDNEQLKWSLKHAALDTFGFSGPYGLPFPQMFQPVIETAANRSFFFDSPIEGMADEGKMPEARYNAYTSETARKMGEWTGLSPKKLQHIVEGYTGTMGGYALGVSDMVFRGFMDLPDEPASKISDYPVVKSFYRGTENRSSQYMTDMYDMLQEAEQVYRTVKFYRESGRYNDADALIEANREQLSQRKQLLSVRRRMSAIRKQMTTVENDRNMSRERKRVEIDRLNRERMDLAKRVVTDLED